MMVDYYSAASVRLQLRVGSKSLPSATGFFWHSARDQKVWLVTNLHVTSGRSTISGLPIHPEGKRPDKIICENARIKSQIANPIEFAVELYDNLGNGVWFQHPVHHEKVDVAAITLPSVAVDFMHLNGDQQVPMDFSVGSDLFIVGYPQGSFSEFWPIWKRGSIASEPDLNLKNVPMFYIDSSTKSGMSGSPVIMKVTTSVPLESGDLVVTPGRKTRFLGVYAGRDAVTKDESEMQIGRVYKSSVIEEIILGGFRTPERAPN
jgi:hypothetical protein